LRFVNALAGFANHLHQLGLGFTSNLLTLKKLLGDDVAFNSIDRRLDLARSGWRRSNGRSPPCTLSAIAECAAPLRQLLQSQSHAKSLALASAGAGSSPGFLEQLVELLKIAELARHLLPSLSVLASLSSLHRLGQVLARSAQPLTHLLGHLLRLSHLLKLLLLLLIEVFTVLNGLLQRLGILRQFGVHAGLTQRVLQRQLLLRKLLELLSDILQLLSKRLFLLLAELAAFHLLHHGLQQLLRRTDIAVGTRLGKLLTRPISIG